MRALLVLGGDAPSADWLRALAKEADWTVAADRGLLAFDRAGILPDCILGDMDSVPQAVLAHYTDRVETRRLNPIKDDTDGVDALDQALDRGADSITLLGALGGRLDHALANLMLLVRAASRGAFAEIRAENLRIFRVPGEVELIGAQGDTVSLLPLGRCEGVSVEGFFYPLRDGILTSAHPLGISNVVTAERATVCVSSGDLILFHHHRLFRGDFAQDSVE